MLTAVPSVPHVELADPQGRWDRALTEIADAREVLWGNDQRTTPITPDEEARRIIHWLHHPRDRIAGKHLHPRINDDRIVAHNLAVARALQQLEQQATTQETRDRDA